MKNIFLAAGAALVLLSALVSSPLRPVQAQDGTAEVGATTTDFVAPIVFQAAGPTAASIQNTIAEYRLALGGANNGNGGPQADGRREITGMVATRPT